MKRNIPVKSLMTHGSIFVLAIIIFVSSFKIEKVAAITQEEPVRLEGLFGNVAVGKVANQYVLLGSNIDTDVEQTVVLEVHQPSNLKYAAIMVVSETQKIVVGGLNDAGLACIWAPILTGQFDSVIGDVLGTANDVKEAILLLLSEEWEGRAVGSFVIGDKLGRLAWLEGDGENWDVRNLADEGSERQVVAVNAFTSPLFHSGDGTGLGEINDRTSNHWWRYQRLQMQLERVNPARPESLAAILSDQFFANINPKWNLAFPGWGFAIANPPRKGDMGWFTKASFLLDPVQGVIWFLDLMAAQERKEYHPFQITRLQVGDQFPGNVSETAELGSIPWRLDVLRYWDYFKSHAQQRPNSSQEGGGGNEKKTAQLAKVLEAGTSRAKKGGTGTQKLWNPAGRVSSPVEKVVTVKENMPAQRPNGSAEPRVGTAAPGRDEKNANEKDVSAPVQGSAPAQQPNGANPDETSGATDCQLRGDLGLMDLIGQLDKRLLTPTITSLNKGLESIIELLTE